MTNSRNNIRQTSLSLKLAACLLTLGASVTTALAADPEVPTSESVVVPTKTLVSGELLKGEGYEVAPSTTVYQGVAIFKLQSEFGSSSLVGVEGLRERLDELRAIEQLREMKGTKVYGDALKASAMAPVETVKNLASSPVDTVVNIGRGLGGFLSDVGYSMVSDDPNQESVAKTAGGFAVAKRQFAYGLGVSPYSSFQPLQDELSEVSWVSIGGGLTASLGFGAIDGGAGTLIKSAGTADSMRSLTRDNSPRELQNINHDKLLAMGIKESLADAMLDNYNYDPENETRLIGALASMDGVSGRELFIQRAALQDQAYNARLMREWAELFAAYNKNVGNVKAIVVAQTAPYLLLNDGTVLGLFPADYVTIDPTFEARNQAHVDALRSQGFKPGEAWVTGKVDPAVEPLMIKIGWKKMSGDAARLIAANNGKK
jgi:hypothetical protein